MALVVIGKRDGGSALSAGHARKDSSSQESVNRAFRTELDQLYAKMNGSGSLAETNWGSDDGGVSGTPHERQVVEDSEV